MPPRLIASSATRAAQRRLGLALRSRVAGDDAPERARRIWGSEGERWFTSEDPIWRVNADAAMFPGGISALLLQSLHPSAMAGVAGHSGYKGDPWGRLQRTSHYLAVTTFGTIADAKGAIEHVRSVHRFIRGTDERGRPYAAEDPHLLRWVHVAEIWSFLECHRLYGRTRLSPQRQDEYVRQAARTGVMLGAKQVPTSVAELDAALEEYRPELESSPAALDARHFLLNEPPVGWTEKPTYLLLREGAVAALPPWARTTLELPDGPFKSRVTAERLGRTGVSTLRWVLDAVDA